MGLFNFLGMITCIESRALDKNAEFFGVPLSQLMENAGQAVAEVVWDRFHPARVAILCGPGNNGGDGFVAARYLADKSQVTIVLADPLAVIKTPLAQDNYRKAKDRGIPIDVYCLDAIKGQDVIVDAMLGSGLRGGLQEPYQSIVQDVNTLSLPVVSVDIPTGHGGPIAVCPKITITFHDIKENMVFATCGEILIRDIGIPSDAVTYVGPGDLQYYPRPQPTSHKGENGRVLVVAGGPYTGAPALVGLAVLRTGADLAYILTPQKCWEIVASFSPNLIVVPLKGDFFTTSHIPQIEKFIPRIDSVVVGPGLGKSSGTAKAVKELVTVCRDAQKALVVDADAIGILRDVHDFGCMVITPHAREFKDLTGDDPEIPHVQEWARAHGVTLLVKGPVDIVTDGTRVKLNNVHTVGMTVGGSGDVLAGIVGSLRGKGAQPFDAARMGVFLNGMAGIRAFDTFSYGMVATDIIDHIPLVLKNYL